MRGALKPLQTNEKVELVFEEPGADLPELHTDEAKLGQILRNLVSNALKFTDAGWIRLELDLQPRGDGVRARWSVTDTGVGFSADESERLFDRFQQADGSSTRRFGGCGLGLTICRQLAEQMGGALAATSEPGRGSTFTLTLDLDPADSVGQRPTSRAAA